MEAQSWHDDSTRKSGVTLTMDGLEYHEIQTKILDIAIHLASEKLAELFVEQHAIEILGKLDMQAIANMVVAHAGAKINETLNKKMPDKILEIHHKDEGETKVYQRGIFGGMKRL